MLKLQVLLVVFFIVEAVKAIEIVKQYTIKNKHLTMKFNKATFIVFQVNCLINGISIGMIQAIISSISINEVKYVR